jgi:hypothetical protein
MNHNDNPVDVYERLADAMDALPSGYTRTPSKIEIELIKIVFSYEEASLAGQLTRTPETAAEIAQRVGLDEEKVTVLLESMIPRRMVRADTLALETGVKGLGKVEVKAGEKQAPPGRNIGYPLSSWAGSNPTCRRESRTRRDLPSFTSNM